MATLYPRPGTARQDAIRDIATGRRRPSLYDKFPTLREAEARRQNRLPPTTRRRPSLYDKFPTLREAEARRSGIAPRAPVAPAPAPEPADDGGILDALESGYRGLFAPLRAGLGVTGGTGGLALTGAAGQVAKLFPGGERLSKDVADLRERARDELLQSILKGEDREPTVMESLDAIPGAGDIMAAAIPEAWRESALGRIAEPLITLGGNMVGDPTSLFGVGYLARAALAAQKAARAKQAGKTALEGLKALGGLAVSPAAGAAYLPEMVESVAASGAEAARGAKHGLLSKEFLVPAIQTAEIAGMGWLVGRGVMNEPSAGRARAADGLIKQAVEAKAAGRGEDALGLLQAAEDVVLKADPDVRARVAEAAQAVRVETPEWQQAVLSDILREAGGRIQIPGREGAPEARPKTFELEGQKYDAAALDEQMRELLGERAPTLEIGERRNVDLEGLPPELAQPIAAGRAGRESLGRGRERFRRGTAQIRAEAGIEREVPPGVERATEPPSVRQAPPQGGRKPREDTVRLDAAVRALEANLGREATVGDVLQAASDAGQQISISRAKKSLKRLRKADRRGAKWLAAEQDVPRGTQAEPARAAQEGVPYEPYASGEPDPSLRDAEQRYVDETGRREQYESELRREYEPLTAERRKAIADAYESATHAPDDPAVRRSYDALQKDLDEQYDFFGREGYRFEPHEGEGEPYRDSADMRRDVRENKRLRYLKTDTAFGKDEVGLPSEHPMLERSAKTGLLYNDMFRAIHDLVGHAKEGTEFGPRGEEAAWREHVKIFSPEARNAVTVETRGQNTWVNFGRHLRDAEGRVPKKGEEGYVPPRERQFAEQKAAALPEEYVVRQEAVPHRDLPAEHKPSALPDETLVPVKRGEQRRLSEAQRGAELVSGGLRNFDQWRRGLGVRGAQMSDAEARQLFEDSKDVVRRAVAERQKKKVPDIAKRDPKGWWKRLWGEGGPLAKQRLVQGKKRPVGAPASITSPDAFLQKHAELMEMAREGQVARGWYPESSRAILEMMGGNRGDARTFAQLVAIYSPQTAVRPNWEQALRAWTQFKGGAKHLQAGGTRARDAHAEALLFRGEEFEGRKRNNFYGNLMLHIDPKSPELRDLVTVDVHMMRAIGHDVESAGFGPQYEWSQNMVRDVAFDLGWEPHEVQAAIWTSQKFRREVLPKALKKGAPPPPVQTYSFLNARNEMFGQVNFEAIPHPKSGDLPGIHRATYEQRQEYTDAVRRALLDEQGRDVLARELGIPAGELFDAPGFYEGRLEPGLHSPLQIPSEGSGPRFLYETLTDGWSASSNLKGLDAVSRAIVDNGGYHLDPDTKTAYLPGTKTKARPNGVSQAAYKKLAVEALSEITGQPVDRLAAELDRTRTIDPRSRALVAKYAAALGIIFRQDGVGYGRPLPAKKLADANGLHVDIGRLATPDETARVAEALRERLGLTVEEAGALFPKTTPNGVDLVSFGQKGKAFVDAARIAAKEVFGDSIRQSGGFTEHGGLISNDWGGNPNGERYRARLAAPGSPDVSATVQRLRAAVESVNADFSRRYGWDRAEPEARTGDRVADPGLRVAGRGPETARGPPEYEAPRTDAEARDAGRDAVDALRTQGEVRSLGKRLREAGAGVRTTAQTIIRAFKERGRVDLRGKRVRDAQDLAAIAQVYRDPRFETFRVYYVVDGKIVAHEGITSRQPGFVTVFTRPERARQIYTIRNRIERIRKREGGDVQVWLSHNHPSAEPRPSTDDATLTRLIRRDIPELQGHVVTDFERYGYIDPGGTPDVRDLAPEARRAIDQVGEGPARGVLGGELLNADTLAVLGGELHRSPDHVTLIYTDAQGKVRAVQEMPRGMFLDAEQASNYIANRRADFGADRAFAAGLFSRGQVADEAGGAARDMIDAGVLMDAVAITPGGPSRLPGREPTARAEAIYRRRSAREGRRIRVSEEGKAYRRDPDAAPPFFSQLRKVADSPKLPKAAPGGSMLSFIRKQPGVKADEMAWTGLDDFLAGKKRVTAEEVRQHLEQNRVEIREVTKAGTLADREQARRAELAERYDELTDTERAEWETLQGRQVESMIPGQGPKFGEWQLPGGENYREVLLTLPREATSRREPVASAEALETGDTVTVTSRGLAGEAGDIFTFTGNTKKERLSGEWLWEFRDRNGETTWLDRYQVESSYFHREQGVYTGGHFDELNVLAHLRLNDRVDVDGKRVLFIEEIQSDWHQKGRKEGYVGASEAEARSRLDALLREEDALGFDSVEVARWTILGDADFASRWDVSPQLERAANEWRAIARPLGVPDAPFKTTWHEMAFRRALKMAADEGYERVAWTTGEQQNARYDLSTRLESVSHAKQTAEIMDTAGDMVEGQYVLGFVELGGRPVGEAGLRRLADQVGGKVPEDGSGGYIYNVPENRLADVVGKDVAERIVRGEGALDEMGNRHLRGEDLSVGGSGMKGFYDQMLPKYASKFGKKFGAKAGETQLGSARRPLDVEQTGPSSWLVFVRGEPATDYPAFGSRAEAEAYKGLLEGSPKRMAAEAQRLRDEARRPQTTRVRSHLMSQAEGLLLREQEALRTPRVHSIDITPKMRETVRSEGVALFQEGKPYQRGDKEPERLGRPVGPGESPRVEARVGDLRESEAQAGLKKSELDRDTRRQWDQLDNEVRDLIQNRSDDEFFEIAQQRNLRDAEVQAWDARVHAKANRADEAAEALAKAKATGDKRAIARAEQESVLRAIEHAAAQRMQTNDLTGTARALAAAGRMMRAMSATREGLEPGVAKAFERVVTSDTADAIVKQWKKTPWETATKAERLYSLMQQALKKFKGRMQDIVSGPEREYDTGILQAAKNLGMSEKQARAFLEDFKAKAAVMTQGMGEAARLLKQAGKDLEKGEITTAAAFQKRLFKEIPGLTPEQAARMTTLFRSNPAGLPDALRMVFNGQKSAVRRWTDYALEWWKAGLLSAFSTDAANMTGNSIEVGLRNVKTAVAAGVDTALDWLPKSARGEGAKSVYMAEAAAELQGWSAAFPAALKTLGHDMRNVFMLKDKPIDPRLSKLEFQPGAIPGVAGRIARTSFGKLTAEDDFFRALGKAAEMAKLAYRQARAEVKAGKAANVNARTREILVDISENPERHVALLKKVAKAETDRVFQTKGGAFTQWLQDGARTIPPLQIVVPFIRTPANLVKAAAKRSPLGFVDAAKAWREWKAGKIDRAEFAERMADPILGSMIAAGFLLWAQQGGMSGGGPTDSRENSAKRETGWQPYSFIFRKQNGDKVYIPFTRFEPISVLLGFVADMNEAQDIEDQGDLFDKALGSVMQNLTNRTYLKGLADAGSLIAEPRQFSSRYVTNLTGSIVPNIIGRAAWGFDPYYRDVTPEDEGLTGFAEKLGKTIQKRIPFASRALPTRRGPTGRPIKTQSGGLSRFAAPVQVSRTVPDREVEQLMVEIGYAPSLPGREIIRGGVRVRLTEAEYELLTDAHLRATEAIRERLLNRRSFQRLPDTQSEGGRNSKEFKIRQIYSRARADAQQRIQKDYDFRQRFKAAARETRAG